MTAAVTDLGIARLVKIEEQIGESESKGLKARWEFGRELVAARDGKGRLPNGYLKRVVEETGASRSEIKYRMQFADRYPTDAQLATVVASSPSWYEIRSAILPAHGGDDADGPDLADDDAGDLPEGEFRVIVADPPWQYGNTKTRGAAEDHYGTMTIAELVELDVESRAADQAHLYLWVTNNFIREGFELVDAWGFDYKTCLTWVKPQMGMGNYFRGCTEHVLFAVRGGLGTNANDIRNWFQAPRGRHSAKPDSFYDLVEKASPGPYLEMFSRRSRFGWSAWGNQALQDAEVNRVAA